MNAIRTDRPQFESLAMRPESKSDPRIARCWVFIPGLTAHRFLSAFLLLGAVSILTGCGSETYERRLAETVQYFEYLEDVNDALESQVWNEAGVSLRVPNGFVLLPPPDPDAQVEQRPTSAIEGISSGFLTGQPGANPADDLAFLNDPPLADDEMEEPPGGFPSAAPGELMPHLANDPRQPKYLGLTLPGLEGAWRADVEVIQGQQTIDSACFLYVLSNHSLWLQREAGIRVEPMFFHRMVAEQVAYALGMLPPSEMNPWPWVEERIPRGLGYVPKKNMQLIELQQQVGSLLLNIAVYRYQTKDTQVVIVLVVPNGMDRPQIIAEGINLCLQQMKVDGAAPTRRASTKGPNF